jgi:hypothetical protein
VHPVVRKRRFTPVLHFPDRHEISVQQLNESVPTDMQMHGLKLGLKINQQFPYSHTGKIFPNFTYLTVPTIYAVVP